MATETTPRLITKAEDARHRKVSEPYITKVAQNGVLVMRNGKVDVAATDIVLDDKPVEDVDPPPVQQSAPAPASASRPAGEWLGQAGASFGQGALSADGRGRRLSAVGVLRRRRHGGRRSRGLGHPAHGDVRQPADRDGVDANDRRGQPHRAGISGIRPAEVLCPVPALRHVPGPPLGAGEVAGPNTGRGLVRVRALLRADRRPPQGGDAGTGAVAGGSAGRWRDGRLLAERAVLAVDHVVAVGQGLSARPEVAGADADVHHQRWISFCTSIV